MQKIYTWAEVGKYLQAGSGSPTVPGSLLVYGYAGRSEKIKLPARLTVKGFLDLSFTGTTVLPEGLTVEGNLDIRGTKIRTLPADLTVTGAVIVTPRQLSKRRKIPAGVNKMKEAQE